MMNAYIKNTIHVIIVVSAIISYNRAINCWRKNVEN